MSTASKIEWTRGDDGSAGATWNPVTGCTEVSEGCGLPRQGDTTHGTCYAKTFAERWRGVPGHPYAQGFDVRLWPERLALPLRWRKPRRVFVNSMSDLFHDAVPDEFIEGVFAVMAAAPQHTFQVLTKRPGRMASLLNDEDFRLEVAHQLFALAVGEDGRVDDALLERATNPNELWPLPNVWLGTSVESDRWARIRVPKLIATPAARRFLSCEPLLGPVDLSAWLPPIQPGCFTGAGGPLSDRDRKAVDEFGRYLRRLGGQPTIDWVICGGESGPGARPMHPGWARALRDQSTAAGVAFFFKQWGAWQPRAWKADGGTHALHVAPDVHCFQRLNHHPNSPERTAPADEGWQAFALVGKKHAGRELDGRTWDQFPAPAAAGGATGD